MAHAAMLGTRRGLSCLASLGDQTSTGNPCGPRSRRQRGSTNYPRSHWRARCSRSSGGAGTRGN
jgi:hypothetical protein